MIGVVVDGLESAVLMLDVGVCGLATAMEVCTFRLAMRTRRDQRLLGIDEKGDLHKGASALLCAIPVRARDIDGGVSSSLDLPR